MMSLRVIDFFCGAGGFSEGFRQQGYHIVKGIDNWKLAVDTHNLNHGLSDEPVDILEFEKSIEAIEALPDVEVLIGSPPCVNFSMSNRAGKADKSLGIRLIEAYLRVVAVKKHKNGSILRAWLMENVPNSRNFVNKEYTFEGLGLAEWARMIKKQPSDVALRVKDNGDLLTASDYGSPQSRQRFICGEVIATNEFPYPVKTHGSKRKGDGLKPYLTLGDIRSKMPSPMERLKKTTWSDPNYPSLKLPVEQITDHFYDTGVYQVEWEMARFQKQNHPYMGRMSFPEDDSRPSRTIMATRSASTREAIIFRSELIRQGDGEYRLPTIREAATLMGFPYTYQFLGGESSKWKLIGNAVCPHMASALAKEIKRKLNQETIGLDDIDFESQKMNFLKVNNLNNPNPNTFYAPPRKKRGAKFRMHPFKVGNITVALTNFDPNVGSDVSTNGRKWYCVVYVGAGKEYETIIINEDIFNIIVNAIKKLPFGNAFIDEFQHQYKWRIGDYHQLQSIYEANKVESEHVYSPVTYIESIGDFIKKYDKFFEIVAINIPGYKKQTIPLRQLLAIFTLAYVSLQVKNIVFELDNWNDIEALQLTYQPKLLEKKGGLWTQAHKKIDELKV